jgi:predicted nucleotidyltransferase
MGVKIPNMGNRTATRSAAATSRARRRRAPRGEGLADALFTDTQQRVLGLLFGQPERSFMLSEIIRLARSGTGAVQRELHRLGNSGIITVTSVAGRKYVQANRAAPIFEELRGLIEKTTGVAAELRRILERAEGRVKLAFLFGSVAKGTDAATSDIDVLLVSDDLAQEEAFSWFKAAEKHLGRRISPTIYSTREYLQRRQDHNPFLTKVLAGRYVVLLGSVDDVGT